MLGYTYLAQKKDLESLGPNDLAGYPFIGCIHLGEHAESSNPIDIQLTYLHLAGFRKLDFIFFLGSDIEEVPSNSFLHGCLKLFALADQPASSIAVYTHIKGISDEIYLNPVIKRFTVSEDKPEYPLLNAVSATLDSLLTKTLFPQLDNMPFAWPPKKKGLVLPNGPLVQSLVDQFPSKTAFLRYYKQSTKKKFINEATLNEMLTCVPVTKDTLEFFSDVIKYPISQIQLSWIKPKPGVFADMRSKTGLTKAELCRDNCIGVPEFFEIVENAPLIPAECFRFLIYIFKDKYGLMVRPISVVESVPDAHY